MVEVAGVEPASNAFMPSEYYERSWLRSQHQMRPLLRPGSDRRRHHRYRKHVDSCGTYRGFFCRVPVYPVRLRCCLERSREVGLHANVVVGV